MWTDYQIRLLFFSLRLQLLWLKILRDHKSTLLCRGKHRGSTIVSLPGPVNTTKLIRACSSWVTKWQSLLRSLTPNTLCAWPRRYFPVESASQGNAWWRKKTRHKYCPSARLQVEDWQPDARWKETRHWSMPVVKPPERTSQKPFCKVWETGMKTSCVSIQESPNSAFTCHLLYYYTVRWSFKAVSFAQQFDSCSLVAQKWQKCDPLQFQSLTDFFFISGITCSTSPFPTWIRSPALMVKAPGLGFQLG